MEVPVVWTLWAGNNGLVELTLKTNEYCTVAPGVPGRGTRPRVAFSHVIGVETSSTVVNPGTICPMLKDLGSGGVFEACLECRNNAYELA
jgi:hypothetical protein